MQIVLDNIDDVSDDIVFEISGDGIIDGVKSKYISDIFDSQNNLAFRKDIGKIELNASGAESTIFHGFGKNKLLSAGGIKTVIENGKIISKIENYENTGNTRYVIAASGIINEQPSIMAVAIKEYQNENGRKAFYLHEVLTKNKDVSPIMAAQQKAKTAGKTSLNNSIRQSTDISQENFSDGESYSLRGNSFQTLRYRPEMFAKWLLRKNAIIRIILQNF